MDKIKLNLFEKAKQAVAEKHREISWAALLWHQSKGDPRILDGFYREVSEWVANEAVKADRERIKQSCIYDSEGYDCFDEMVFDLLPLPFPQQPDGI